MSATVDIGKTRWGGPKLRGGGALTRSERKRVKTLTTSLQSAVAAYKEAQDGTMRSGLMKCIAQLVEEIRELTGEQLHQLQLIQDKLNLMR